MNAENPGLLPGEELDPTNIPNEPDDAEAASTATATLEPPAPESAESDPLSDDAPIGLEDVLIADASYDANTLDRLLGIPPNALRMALTARVHDETGEFISIVPVDGPCTRPMIRGEVGSGDEPKGWAILEWLRNYNWNDMKGWIREPATFWKITPAAVDLVKRKRQFTRNSRDIAQREQAERAARRQQEAELDHAAMHLDELPADSTLDPVALVKRRRELLLQQASDDQQRLQYELCAAFQAKAPSAELVRLIDEAIRHGITEDQIQQARDLVKRAEHLRELSRAVDELRARALAAREHREQLNARFRRELDEAGIAVDHAEAEVSDAISARIELNRLLEQHPELE